MKGGVFCFGFTESNRAIAPFFPLSLLLLLLLLLLLFLPFSIPLFFFLSSSLLFLSVFLFLIILYRFSQLFEILLLAVDAIGRGTLAHSGLIFSYIETASLVVGNIKMKHVNSTAGLENKLNVSVDQTQNGNGEYKAEPWPRWLWGPKVSCRCESGNMITEIEHSMSWGTGARLTFAVRCRDRAPLVFKKKSTALSCSGIWLTNCRLPQRPEDVDGEMARRTQTD